MSYKPKPISKFIPEDLPTEIQEATKSFEGRWLPKHEYSDDLILYHYTKPDGLLSIVKNRSIWSTNIRFLSDPFELEYGRKIIFNKVKNHYDREENSTIKKILKRLYEWDEAFKNLFPTYISCFSKKNDLLNQWKLYANEGHGYNIGILFNSEDNETKYSRCIKSLSPNRPTILRKVIYDPEEQVDIIEDFIVKIVLGIKDAMKNQNTFDLGVAEMISMKIFNYFIEMMVCIKSPSFKEEQEWRLIDMPLKHEDLPKFINFRISNDRTTPYHNTHIYEERNDSLEFPVQSIKIGPMLDEVRTRRALEIFLNSMSVQSNEITLNRERIEISKSDTKV
jgi:hypothetical protein